MLTHFRDEAGGFYDTSDDHETLLHRPKRDVQDNATPSGNSMAAHVRWRLACTPGRAITGTWPSRWWPRYEPMARYPGAFAHWLSATGFILGELGWRSPWSATHRRSTRRNLATVRPATGPTRLWPWGESGDTVLPWPTARDSTVGPRSTYAAVLFAGCRSMAAALAEQLGE